MLRSCTINHVAAFLTLQEKQYDFCKEEQIRQERSRIDHVLVGPESQLMQMTVLFEFHIWETDSNLQARPRGLLEYQSVAKQWQEDLVHTDSTAEDL